ncbi:divalent-cation tolerance protein CutA [Conexibacter sp. SYSU D00693]|uniref:divalent-cation tolerance protein CutA n=1 Tax=Conexibacter sp. SYSU D00693 TaxID=2812560 RepID=UPI00196AC92F|nr:divalent-cation tolerance protein CutA [Conexibacter sp. SYSU D00693]
MGDPCIVMTTTASREEALSVAQAAVEARLAACGQVLAIESTYVWQGALEREPEHLVLLKTRADLYEALEALVVERHSYDVPEVLQVPVTGGSAAYLGWVAQQTRDAA